MTVGGGWQARGVPDCRSHPDLPWERLAEWVAEGSLVQPPVVLAPETAATAARALASVRRARQGAFSPAGAQAADGSPVVRPSRSRSFPSVAGGRGADAVWVEGRFEVWPGDPSADGVLDDAAMPLGSGDVGDLA